MTITNGYCTLAELKSYCDITTTDTTDDAVLEDLIEAASRVIDNTTHRRFYASTETKYFDVPVDQANDGLLFVDDLISITTLTNGATGALTASYYQLLPLNTSPKWAIQLRGSSGMSWDCDTAGDAEGAITIAGSWGYGATCPDDIKQACLLIANAYRQKRSGQGVDGTAQITSAGIVIEAGDIPRDAARILSHYRKLVVT